MKKTIFCSNPNCKLHILVDETLNKLYIKKDDKEFVYHREFYVLDPIMMSFCNVCIELLPPIL